MKKDPSIWPDARVSLSPPSGISTEEWGRKNRELSTLTSAHSGPWSLDMIPFFRPVLAALDNDQIETVCIQKATQIAGSETVLTWLGKIAAEDPGPAMIVFADEDTAREFCKRRIQPMFRSSPLLSALIIEADFGQESIILKNGFSLTMAWASSIAKTASRPIRYLVCDEITKPAYGQTGAEGSVLSRIFQRAETFPNRKIVMLSSVTAEGDNMDKQMQLCQAVYDFAVPCPDCGSLQVVAFFPALKGQPGGITFPAEGSLQERAAQAKYQCKECKSLWTTAQKNAAVSRGVSVPRQSVPAKAKRIGFHVSRLLSFFPGGRLEALAEAFLLASADYLELQSFYNNSLALHWKHIIKSSESIPIAERKCDLPPKLAPTGTLCLTAGFDMQKFGFWFSVWAHKYEGVSLHSYMIWDGFIETFSQVSDIVYEEIFEVQGGGKKKIWIAGLDTGGGKGTEEDGWSRTAEAYNFLRVYGRETIFGVKGDSKPRDSVVWHTVIDKMPGKNGAALGTGIPLYHMNTGKLKDIILSFRAEQNDEGPSPIFFHKDTSDAYFKQLLAEEKTRNRTTGKLEWAPIAQRENHQLDTAVINQALLDDGFRGGIRLLYRAMNQKKKPAEAAPAKKEEPEENPYAKGILKR